MPRQELGSLELTRTGQAAAPLQGGGQEFVPRQLPSGYILALMFHKHFHVARKQRRLFCDSLNAIYSCLIVSFVVVSFETVEGGALVAKYPFLPALASAGFITFMALSFMTMISVEIIQEKENKMKAIQEIYGLTIAMYWKSWGLYWAYNALPKVMIMVVAFKLVNPEMLGHTNAIFIAVVYMGVYLNLNAVGACISVPFSKMQSGQLCISCSLCIFTPLVAGPLFLQALLPEIGRWIFYVLVFVPLTAVGGAQFLLYYPERLWTCTGPDSCTRGLSFHNLWSRSFCTEPEFDCPSELVLPITAGETILLLWLSVFLYGFLAWWLDNVWPKEFGSRRPVNFCCSSTYLNPQKRTEAEFLVAEAGGQYVGIAIAVRELHKEFAGKAALDGMTLDVYKGELFALLGHNGAGKTTAINCIVGMTVPTSGGAVVNGYDCLEDVGPVRQHITICPQDNPMYDDFTVRQHLSLFGSLRGVTRQQMQGQIGKVLTALGMPEKLGELCTTLSGGQKRRLWVATALLAETPVVFLDEPTSGMDPSSRRHLWNLLKGMRDAGSSITFTTHYLEEADLLADRKAVMARGRIQAVGTSMDLKRRLGVGYHLCVELVPNVDAEKVVQLTWLIQEHIPSGSLADIPSEERTQSSDVARTETYILPHGEIGSFSSLFSALDERGASLGIINYSMAMTSLEEIFMTLGEQAEQMASSTSNEDFREVLAESPAELPREALTFYSQVSAMVRLRYIQVFKISNNLALGVIFPCLLAYLYSTGQYLLLFMVQPLSIGFACTCHLVLMMKEREDQCKHTSLAQGLSVRAYWLGSFLSHNVFALPIGVIIFLGSYAEHFSDEGGDAPILLALAAIIAPLGWIIATYAIMGFFEKKETVLSFFSIITILVSALPGGAVWALISREEYERVAQVIHVVMSLCNPFYLFPGVVATIEISSTPYLWSWCSIPLYGSFLSISAVATCLIVADSRSYETTPGDPARMDSRPKDDDVVTEEERVQKLVTPEQVASQAACVQGLMHTYRTNVDSVWKENHAIRGITFGVHRGECFGVLGPNGAGKSTTLSVLTGLVRPHTAGRVFVQGFDISNSTDMQEAFKQIGVCPQQDPQWEGVTGRDHLLFYGRIKGVPTTALEATVDNLLTRLGLKPADANKPAKEYSGGMKRKLSIAFALIGQPPLVFLDEPSAGVDAAAKRHLWKVIKMRMRDMSVIVTTHSMEEAEALCDRIAIQVKGELRCIGSPHHIKRKYASGYQLEVFCQAVDAEESLLDFVQRHISVDVHLIEHHVGRYLFSLPPLNSGPGSLTFGQVFTTMQTNMESLRIIDYALSQPSLEQVFLRFAREQEDADE